MTTTNTTISATSTTAASCSSLEHLCSIEDLFHRHLVPFLSCQDVGRLEATTPTLQQCLQAGKAEPWKILCERDYTITQNRQAPFYSTVRQSFDTLKKCRTWKRTYQQWKHWQTWTHGGAQAPHMVQAIGIWQRLQTRLDQCNLTNILDSFRPALESELFAELAGQLPSSLVALYSISGGQANLRPRGPDYEFFAGLLGSYSCYNDFYSMRLIGVPDMFMRGDDGDTMILVGISPGNPRMFLYVHPTPDDPEGNIVMVHHSPVSNQSIRAEHPVVGRGGLLAYLQSYVERLEAGVYQPVQIIPESPTSRGVGLFANANLEDSDSTALMSCAVTHGMEVRASARWFPGGIQEQLQGAGLNFGYSIRIRMVGDTTLDPNPSTAHDNPSSTNRRTCQLEGRHWEFTAGDGSVRRVDGDGVIGKQPLFFRDATGQPGGYVDLGPAGDRDRHVNEVFVYQSQSGPVADTTQHDTKAASVKGTFSFVPGSIANPTGPLFHVTVAPFPLTVPFPFY